LLSSYRFLRYSKGAGGYGVDHTRQELLLYTARLRGEMSWEKCREELDFALVMEQISKSLNYTFEGTILNLKEVVFYTL
jgi:hypothetical protein